MQSTGIIGHLTACQLCDQEPLSPILSFGHLPPVHAHLTEQRLHESENTYPLNLCKCSACGLLQIDYAVDPKILFAPEYPYHSGMTNMLINNFRALAETVTQTYALAPDSLVIDLGSNDGTLLKPFKEKGMRVLGVEPTDNARVAEQNGIPTLQAFFDTRIANEIVAQYGKAKVVTATNVFAHINNHFEFLAGVKTLLDADGVFVSESQYLMDIVEKLELDTIYHEHLRYYSLKPLITLLEKAGLSLIDAERITAAGGSIRVYAQVGKKPRSARVHALIEAEERAGISDDGVLKQFAGRCIDAKHAIQALLLACKKDGARIAGLGAAGRSNTLLGFTKLDNTILDYLCERMGSPKIGLYSPGSHILIVDEERLLREQPEYAFVLSWHIGDELMKKMRDFGYKGKFIMPLPEPRIIG